MHTDSSAPPPPPPPNGGNFAPPQRAAGGKTNPAPKLVQLRQAEALGVLDHHERSVGHVHPHFDHGRGDQELDRARREGRHDLRLPFRRHAAVHQAHPQLGEFRHERGVGLEHGLELQRLRFLDQRAHPVGLAPGKARFVDAAHDFVPARIGYQLGDDRPPAGGHLVDDRNVQIGVVAHRQRARNGRRAHHEQVRLDAPRLALGSQRQSLLDAEAVLLVHDRKRERAERHLFLNESVGAEHDPGRPRRDPLEHRAALLARLAAGQPGERDAERRDPLGELAEMLLGEDFGRRHHRRLRPVLHRAQAGERRHDGLAAAHVALEQAVHRVGLRQVRADLAPGPHLRAGQLEGKPREHRPHERSARGKRCGTLGLAFAIVRAHRQLLCEQLVELDPPPRRMRPCAERLLVRGGAGAVQRGDRRGESIEAELRAQRFGQRLVEFGALERLRDQPAQRGLGESRGDRIDRRERGRQRLLAVQHVEARMDHLAAEQAAAGLPEGAHARTRRERLGDESGAGRG